MEDKFKEFRHFLAIEKSICELAGTPESIKGAILVGNIWNEFDRLFPYTLNQPIDLIHDFDNLPSGTPHPYDFSNTSALHSMNIH